MKGSVGLSSALSRPVLLRVRVAAGADVHFTTTISVYVSVYSLDFSHTPAVSSIGVHNILLPYVPQAIPD